MTFNLYDVEGVDHPLRLSPEHAKTIGATKHVPADTDDEADDGDPKPGTKAALVAEAERLGLATDGTKADLEARIAEVG